MGRQQATELHVDKDKLLRKVQGLKPSKRSTANLTEEQRQRYKREVGRSADDRAYYVSSKKEPKSSAIELEDAQRTVGQKEADRALPDEIKKKVQQARRTLKPSR